MQDYANLSHFYFEMRKILYTFAYHLYKVQVIHLKSDHKKSYHIQPIHAAHAAPSIDKFLLTNQQSPIKTI